MIIAKMRAIPRAAILIELRRGAAEDHSNSRALEVIREGLREYTRLYPGH
jgi:hypothetical protein